MTKRADFSSRVSDIIHSLFGETHDVKSSEEEQEISTLDYMAASFADFLDHLNHGKDFLRFHAQTGRDRIIGLGNEIEIAVELDPIRGLVAQTIEFTLNDIPIGVAKRDELNSAFLRYSPEKEGYFEVKSYAIDARGKKREMFSKSGPVFLQVVDSQPVACIDVSLVFTKSREQLDILNKLAQKGWVFCYADLIETDRTASIREEIRSKGLPEGSVLVHPAEESGFDMLNVDFQQVFAVTTMRRILTSGVPLVLHIGDEKKTSCIRLPENLVSYSLEELSLLSEDDDKLSHFNDIAERFSQQWRSKKNSVRWYLDMMTDSKPLSGNWCGFELDNKKARNHLFDTLMQSQHSIHIQFYILKESRFVDFLSAILISRARQGVRVRLLVDALYSGQEVLGFSNKILKSLATEKNIDVIAVDPIRATDELEAIRLKQRDHRKLIVIDGKKAFVSGRNAGDEYYTGFDEVPITDWTHADRIPWLDAHIEIEGPLVAKIQSSFLETWKENGGEAPESDDRLFRGGGTGGTMDARLIIHNGISDSNGLCSYEAIIESAKKHLYIVNDFPVVSRLADALRIAAHRGISIRFLTGNAVPRRSDGSFFKGALYRELFEYMTKQRFEIFMKYGIALYEFTTAKLPFIVSKGGLIRPYVHAKIMSADGKVASIGSANLDATASYWERETNVIVENDSFVSKLESELQMMIDRSFQIDPDSDYWKAEVAQREIVSRLWPDSLFS